MMCALHDLARPERRARALRVRARRGVRGDRPAHVGPARQGAATSATSRSPASRPTCTSASRPRACWRCGSWSTARSAHGSTPWLGDNAVLKAIDVFRRIESMPFTLESSELFDRPSINLGPDHRAATRQQGARGMRHGRRHPLSARARTRASCSRRSARCRTSQVARIVHLAARARLAARTRTCSRSAQAAVAAHRRRVDERRPRRRLRRGGVPEGGRAGGRVRPRPAAATTARTSGSRSTRCARYRRALVDFARSVPALSTPRPSAAGRGGRAGVKADGRPAAPGRGVLLRALLAGILDDRAVARPRSRPPSCSRSTTSSTSSSAPEERRTAIDIPEVTRADAGDPRTFLILGSDARYATAR